jgi:uncharacterized protein
MKRPLSEFLLAALLSMFYASFISAQTDPVVAESPTSIAQDAPRLALIIGNSAYKIAKPLSNPANDADLMAATLEKIGFQVTKITNADYVTMNKVVVQYANSLPKNAISLVYYAGHGVQVEGQNYLLPIDIDPTSKSDLPFLSLSVDKLLGIFKDRDAAANIFILDACRNNPFEDDAVRSVAGGDTRGLAPIVSGFRGSLIAYSTGPGKVAQDGDGKNSPYSLALSKALERPGLSIESVFKLARAQVIGATDFKQVPWENSSLTQDIYLSAHPEETADLTTQVTQCDTMAGHPSDPERVYVGIDYTLLRPGPAIAACRADLENDPQNPRLMTELARALAKNGDLAEALELDQKAVEMGYLGGYHNLGNHYRRGEIVKKDLLKALELFTYSAQRGHPEDAYNVGVLYREGEGGVEQSFAKAKDWFERSAAQNYPSAFDKLGLMSAKGEGQPADPSKAFEYFARGAELGDASAIVNLGTAYRKGEGIAVDYAKALSLFQRAAKLRRTSAYTNLAEMYRKGQGVDSDPVEALFWYQLAASQGNSSGQEQAAKIIKTLDPKSVASVDKRVQDWINGDFG